MNPIRFFVRHSLFIFGFAGCLLLLVTSKSFAADDANVDAGLAAAKDWTGMIDGGQYEESYNASSDSLRQKLDANKWSVLLKTFRDSWGPVVNRKETNHIYKPNGFEGADGQFLVITYDTSFQKVGELMEVVVMRWEGGQWKGAGYNGGPMPPAPGSDQAPAFVPAQADTQTTTAPMKK
jgi:hypothetical protein